MHRQIDLTAPTVYRVITVCIVGGVAKEPYPLGPYATLKAAKSVLSRELNQWTTQKQQFEDVYDNDEREFYIEESPLVWTRVP